MSTNSRNKTRGNQLTSLFLASRVLLNVSAFFRVYSTLFEGIRRSPLVKDRFEIYSQLSLYFVRINHGDFVIVITTNKADIGHQ